MAKRMIYADELKEKLWFLFKWFGQLPCNESDKITQQAIKKCISEVDKAHTVDAVEVVHGKWAVINNYCCVCSACHNASTQTYYYCPECGAKMDLEGE